MKPLVNYRKSTLTVCWTTVLLFEFIRDDSVGKACADACPIGDGAATLHRSNL